jgi:hypothetical protein
VRPQLDYCIQAWIPHLQQDIEILEIVQRIATRMVEECTGKSYKERLRILGLTTFETRMARADLIEAYKILNSLEGVEEESFFVRAKRRGRGHSQKLFKKRVKLDV